VARAADAPPIMADDAVAIPALVADDVGAATTVELTNCLPARLSVELRTGRLHIPPLGVEHVDAGAVDRRALDPAVRAGALEIRVIKPPPSGRAGAWAGLLCTAGATAAFFVTLAGSTGQELAYLILAGVAALIVLAVGIWTQPTLRAWAMSAVRTAMTELPAPLREFIMFALAIITVLAVPGAILYFGSDVPGLLQQLDSPRPEVHHNAALALIGIGVQYVCIVGASALPVLLYFIFDRERMLTLRHRVTRHIFRLDAGVRTRKEIDAKYGQWLDEAFGRRRSEARFLPGTRWPILIATAVLTLGWAIALLDTKPTTVVDQGSLTALITPTPTAPTFAFLGAYFFALNNVMRGFVRGDLRPKTYAQVATRIVGSVVLAFTLERMTTGVGGDPSNASLLTFAFVTGVVPETALIRLQEASRGFFVRSRSRSKREIDHASRTYETEPLTRLQGIDIYDRARLLDEGVTNVEGLAHHDLVELLLKTRIPASRLIDWVDQAILFIHCSCTCEQVDARSGNAPSVLAQLRAHGIRTATELRRAHDEASSKTAFAKIVATPEGKPPILDVVLHAIAQEDWIDPLMHWHKEPVQPRTVKIPEAYA
jgi:hypothetical protein